jgi:hypothetical protein
MIVKQDKYRRSFATFTRYHHLFEMHVVLEILGFVFALLGLPPILHFFFSWYKFAQFFGSCADALAGTRRDA